MTRTLDEQLDLQEVAVDPVLHVYRNVAWAPARAALSPTAAQAAGNASYFPTAAATDLTGTPTALPAGDGRTTARGPVADSAYIYVAQAAADGWRLTVDGKAVPRSLAFGWANGFTVAGGGAATLSYRTPITRYLVLLLDVALWVGAVVLLVRARRRRQEETAA